MLRKPGFHSEKKLGEEDGEWVLGFQIDRSGLVERDMWMRIGTERVD
jgi:hypothetical protein